jgi:hypothetical protein
VESRPPACQLLTLAEVRQRLTAVRAELERLERDRSVFARAFHTQVAHAVHAALTEDETRLAALPPLELPLGDDPERSLRSTVLDVQPWSDLPPAGRCEVLDL